jgi:signal transduction histidine kinase
LINNAIKYSHEGGTVTLRVFGVDDSLQIEVADTGIGIPAADQDRVFEEFYRSEEARKLTPDGTGLGLSIVRTIAEAHGGTVTVESAVGVGTKFTVTLPLSGCPESGLEGTSPPPSASAG